MRPFIFLLLLSANASAQVGEVRGLITCYFKQLREDKPDMGATIMLLDSTKAERYDAKLSDTFYFGSIFQNIRRSYENINMAVPENIIKRLTTWGVADSNYYKEIDRRETENLTAFASDKNTVARTVDASGSYSMTVPAGIYYVQIASKNKKGNTVTETAGCVYTTKVKVTANETLDLSYNFAAN
jgi:hypothetical protein